MSPALPVVSGAAVVAALAKEGDEQVSQRGSHVKLRRDGRTVIVPRYRELAPGTLRSILRQASLTPAEFVAPSLSRSSGVPIAADFGVPSRQADRRPLDQWLEVRILGGRGRPAQGPFLSSLRRAA